MGKVGPPEGSQNALQHGGAGALKRFLQGQEFIGYALEVQKRVEAELGFDLDSLDALGLMRVKRFCSIEATARMYFDAALSSAAEGDVEAWAKRKRWALYASDKASKEQDKVEEMLAKRGDVVILDAIEAAGDDPE